MPGEIPVFELERLLRERYNEISGELESGCERFMVLEEDAPDSIDLYSLETRIKELKSITRLINTIFSVEINLEDSNITGK